MTGSAIIIWGNIQFDGGSIGPTAGPRECQYRTRELNISPYCMTQKECIMTIKSGEKIKSEGAWKKKEKRKEEKETVTTGIRTQDALPHRARSTTEARTPF